VSNADIRSRPPADLIVVVGTSLKIPGTKRIVRESIKAVHHTPRGKAIWMNLDPPPTKDFDIWIKGDCQEIPKLYQEYEERIVRESKEKAEEIKRKSEEKVRLDEERLERKAREQLRKEENQRERERRKEAKDHEKAERLRKQEERRLKKEQKLAEKARREIERAARPVKKVKTQEMWSRPLTPLSYDTDSTLSSPSLSDIEFASYVETGSTPVKTPTMSRIIGHLPTPAPTPQKGPSETREQDSPLKTKRKFTYIEEADSEKVTARINSMSIQFLTEQD
jgi:flagellar biosynthesis GTPase FlhF